MIPPPAYRDFREAFRQGDRARVFRIGQQLLVEFAAEPDHQGVRPAVLLMLGASLAHEERTLDALSYIEAGLAELPGTPSTQEVGDGDWYALVLLDLQVLAGRYRDAWPVVQRLIEPQHSLETRLAATRAQITLHTTFGQFDTAFQLLNTATGLAERLRNHQLSTIVEGDRAIVLARQGRTIEATSFADRVLPLLGRPVPGPVGAWSAGEAVAVSTTVARHAAEAGDLMTAERMLFTAGEIAPRTGRQRDAAAVSLARGTVAARSGNLVAAEGFLHEARRVLVELSAAPGAAQAQWLEAEVAAGRGLQASARPLFERAREEFAVLGLTGEVARIDSRLQG